MFAVREDVPSVKVVLSSMCPCTSTWSPAKPYKQPVASTGLETIVTYWRLTRTSHRPNYPGPRGRNAPSFLLSLPKSPPGHCLVEQRPGGRPWWRWGRHRESDLPPVPLLPSPLVHTSSAGRRCILLLRTLQRWCWSHHEWAPRALDLLLWMLTPDSPTTLGGSPSRSRFSLARPTGIPVTSSCVWRGHMLGGIRTKRSCWAPTFCRSLGVSSALPLS